MIKLLWNTQKQRELNSNIPKSKLDVIITWGNYHKKNSDKWIFEILNKVKFKLVENISEIENEDILIIVDSSIEAKTDFYNKLNLICSKIFLIHLGDEPGLYNFSGIYNNCKHVWRTFCSSKYFNNDRVSCLPIGYKSGTLFDGKIEKKIFKWTFIGTPHRSSRHDILFQLSQIKPSFIHKTSKFNEKIIEVDKMSEVLSSTEFIPCPNGFFHPETYRLYEALECETIPIVENAFNYYDRLFPGNPFIKVDRWIEAKEIIEKWKADQIKIKREECKNWWKSYKNLLQNNILNRINS
jgi:hypothetical protein